MYATLSDMITRFGADELIQLANRSGVAVSEAALKAHADGEGLSGFTAEEQAAVPLIAAVIDEALEDAAADIDPKLSGRYALPLTAVPRVLVNKACDIARYYLHNDDATEIVVKRFDDAVRFLRGVATGTETLGLDGAGQQADQPAAGVQVSAPAPVFTRDTLKGYL